MKTVTEKLELDRAVAGRRAVVLFHATWCPFCRTFKPTFDEATNALKGWEPVDCVIDDEANPLWAEYHVQIVPTVVFLEDGRVTSRLDGRPGVGLNGPELRGALKRHGATA